MSLTDKLDEQRARLAALEASEAELTAGVDAALQALGAPTDPIRTRAAVGILLRANRQQAAADLLRNQTIDNKWLDLAASVFSSIGEHDRAMNYVDIADKSGEVQLMRRARLGFAEGVVDRWQKSCSDESLLAKKQWDDADKALAQTTLEVLDPLLSLVRASRKVDGEMEVSAEMCALFSSYVLGDETAVRMHAEWLVQVRPLPMVIAELCLRRLFSLPDGLVNRLRVEHPADFNAHLLAALVERELLNQPEEAFESLVALASRAATKSEKESICISVFETCGECSTARLDEAIATIGRVQPSNPRLIRVLEVAKRSADGDLAGARRMLDALRDEADGVWWQAHAHLCEREGNEEEAQNAWEKASLLVPHPAVLRRSVQAALNRRALESAVRSLRILLDKSPNSVKELQALASILVQLGDYSEASECFKRLLEISPDSVPHRLALGQCLGRSARVKDAILVLTPLCEGNDPPLAAILTQSELLEAAGNAAEGFRLLEQVAGDHWDDPQFVLRYMHRAHAAAQDSLAHNAFVRLMELRRGGKVSTELMQEGTLEDLLEYGKEFHQRRESLQNMVVDGRMPWLFAEDVLGNPPLWAWILHTQDLPWVSEEKTSRAAYTVYATNGFTVHATANGKPLKPLAALPRGTEVVLDVSALLTLFQLGRLPVAANYFGRMYIPASYGDLPVRDSGRYGQHQPTREIELQRLRTAIDSGRIRVVDDDFSAAALNEYQLEPDCHSYRLVDVVPALEASQKVLREALDELHRVAHHPSGVDENHMPLKGGEPLLVDLMTLRTLANRTVFEALLDLFVVHINSRQNGEVTAELRAHEKARTARDSHESLWKCVEDLIQSGKLKLEPVPVQSESDDLSEVELSSIYLDAVRLAQHKGIAVLADDRVLQVLALQGSPEDSSCAIGTDCLIRSMVDESVYEMSDAIVDFRQLLRWRYRFLVPTSSMLFAWAEASKGNLPGDPLLDVAAYLHDCLRDPGLHCGFEASEPPMPMAAKFVIAWSDEIVGFLARIWRSSEFSDDAAGMITRWVGEEMIPSCPRGLFMQQTGFNIARAEVDSVMSMAFVQLVAGIKRRRANKGLRLLAEALGLTEDDFLQAAAEAIHVVATP